MTEPREVPDQQTTLSVQDAIDALLAGWTLYFGAPPSSPEKLLTLAAQTALETGWFRSMHCFNFGNVKARPGGAWSWTYFGCNEILSVVAANHAAANTTAGAPCHIKSFTDNGAKAVVWFYPKHPVACFRAFDSAQEGAADHIALLNSPRFESAWPFVDAARPQSFGDALGLLGYYTADRHQYADTCANIYQHLCGLVKSGELAIGLEPASPIPLELRAMAIAARDKSLRDGAFVEHDYPEASIDEA